ncbi:MAG: hypothetical protein IAE90_05230 [Ignavibacteria bacterium]|nr:hypothetical protein [Ignavibacteria bacterium]
MNFKRNFYLLIVVAAMFSHSVNAQPKIKIRLIQPPPDNLNINSMWNLSLENTTRSDLKIYLNGNVTEEKDGLIIEGKSKVFTIKPGKTNYKYSDFSGAEVKYNNGKYKEVILRTGNAPEGSYTICVTAFEENGEIAGMENCIMQTVQQLGSITLISPEDGAELNPEQPLIFTWTPLPKGGPYSLRIVELKGDQSPDVAMQTNRPVFEKADISLTTTQVSYSSIHDPGITILEMKYAWQVTSGDVESEVHTIINKGNSDTTSRATDEPVWENFGAQVRCERLGVTFQAAKKIDVNLYHLFAEFTDIVYYQTTEFVNNHPLPEPNIISYEQLFPDVSDPRLFCDEDGRTISRLNGIWKVTEQNTRNGGYVDLGSTPPVNFSLFTLVNLWNYHHLSLIHI